MIYGFSFIMNTKYEDKEYDIDEEELMLIKQQYGGMLEFDDEDGNQYFYRCLTKGEFFELRNLCINDEGEFDELEFENYVVGTCVILPTSFSVDTTKAGVVSSMAREILDHSGFSSNTDKFTEMLNAAKFDMAEPLNQVACYITEAFPSISLDDIENMPISKILWLFSRADFIFRFIRGIDVNIISPDEYLSLSGIGDFEQTEFVEEENESVSSPQPQGKHKVTKSETTISSGSMADFPELREIEAFMQGKWR